MSDTQKQVAISREEKRKISRRKKARRTHDLLVNMATEEERQAYDKLLWSRFHKADRREDDRRSGDERRDGNFEA